MSPRPLSVFVLAVSFGSAALIACGDSECEGAKCDESEAAGGDIVVTPTDAERVCSTDTDCVAVYAGNQCNTRCPNDAIAASAKTAYATRVSEAQAVCKREGIPMSQADCAAPKPARCSLPAGRCQMPEPVADAG